MELSPLEKADLRLTYPALWVLLETSQRTERPKRWQRLRAMVQGSLSQLARRGP